MSLLTLPAELLTIIIRNLDTQSVCNLYESCGHLRDVISTPAVVRECQFSVNKLATVKSLELDFFNVIAEHLKILNLSGVSDLNKSYLIPALEKLKNLLDLDVSFTQITLPDYLELSRKMNTLKSLAINFSFDNNNKIDKKILIDYQQAFGSLKNIHFVGYIRYLLDNKLVLYILQKAELFTLKFTLCRNNFVSYTVYDNNDWDRLEIIKMSHCQVYFLEEFSNVTLENFFFFKSIVLSEYETVLFQLSNMTEMYSTPFLVEFIKKHFDIEVFNISNDLIGLGQATIMFWSKKLTSFDDMFYSKLLFILRENLIYSFEYPNLTQPVPLHFKRYCVEQNCPSSVGSDSSYDSDYDYFFSSVRKRRKLSYKSYKINYDAEFENKKDINLRITFLDNRRPVTLNNCEFLKNVTHLTLDGDIRYTATFFKKLFELSQCLITLEITKKKGIVSAPLTHLKNSKIKNIFLYIKGSHLFQIFNCLSQCKTLENIHLVDISHTSIYRNSVDPLPNPSELFSKCTGLYNFSFQSHDMYGEHKNEMLRNYKAVRSQLGIEGLNIAMFMYRDTVDDQYNPYLRVFDVFRLKPM